MRPLQYIKRLVVFVFVIEVTSHPTPYGSRLINFLGSSIGARPMVDCGKYCDNGRRHHNQKNIGTGSDSSLVEISFQPLRELESVSSLASLYPLAGKQFFDEDLASQTHQQSAVTPATPPNFAHRTHTPSTPRNFNRGRRTSHNHNHHHLMLNENNDDFQSYHQRYPEESSSIEDQTTTFAPVIVESLNGIQYPAEDLLGFMHHDPQQQPLQNDKDLSREESDKSIGSLEWDIFKGQQPHPVLKDPTEEEHSYLDSQSDVNNKRNALAAFKRQKFKSHQTQFIPSISSGTMTNLGDFFRNLKNNVEFMEKSRLSNSAEVLLEGDHPMQILREELNSDGTKPTGTAAFLHAIRNYRPSQRIRSLVALNPEGYHGSQFLDPNYMWIGLGKR